MQSLKVLILEDRESDALLMIESLKKSGYDPTWHRVDNREDFLVALKTPYDLVLADFALPQFTGESAYRLFQETKLTIPFILVSGTLPDELGVSLMKDGVDDFIFKDRMGRLGEAVKHAFEKRRLALEKQQAEISLHISEEHFRNTFNFSALGIALISLEGKFFRVNRTLCEILNLHEKEILEKNLHDLCASEETPKLLEGLQELLKGTITEYHLETKLEKKLKKPIWTEISVSLLKNESGPSHYIFQFQDTSQRKSAEEKLYNLAHYDILTGFPNWKLIEASLDQSLLNATTMDKKVAVFSIGIDQIKSIDETLGAFVGNPLIKQIAGRLKSRLQNKDMLGVWSRGQFILVLSDLENPEMIEIFTQKIQEIFKDPIVSEMREFYITCSIGVALYPEHSKQSLTLINSADIAMNRAKTSGAASVQVFDPAMFKEVQERLELQNHLNTGIQQNEFYLHYQPIIDFENRQIVSVEALLRWNSKEKGQVPPEKFIPVAEESQLICTLGEWVLKNTCLAASELAEEGYAPIIFDVNISARQLRDKKFLSTVESILKETKMNPAQLRLEVTEKQLMQNLNEAIYMLQAFIERGIQIAIDDFGIAYSCFNYLKLFSVHRLKIDKSFVHNIHQKEKEKAIVTAMIAMSRELNIQCIAEGVESQQEFDFLKSIGCCECQGFFFSKPVELAEFKKLARKTV